MKSQVLDKGFIEVVDSLGNDLTVVNSARVSFGKRKTKWDKSDERLVRYLAKYKHYSPFRHLQVQFHIKAPEFVMRQWYKHVVGIETTSIVPLRIMLGMKLVVDMLWLKTSTHQKYSENNQRITNKLQKEQLKNKMLQDIIGKLLCSTSILNIKNYYRWVLVKNKLGLSYH